MRPATRTEPGVDMAGLRRSVDSFIAFIGARAPSAPRDGWSADEVLAHLAYWHEHYVRIVRARLAGREPRLPDASFTELNAVAVAHFRGRPSAEVAAHLATAQAALERLGPAARAARTHVRIKVGAKAWPWGPFLQRVEAHIREHERKLRHRAVGRVARRPPIRV